MAELKTVEDVMRGIADYLARGREKATNRALWLDRFIEEYRTKEEASSSTEGGTLTISQVAEPPK